MLDKHWVTHSGYFRLTTIVALGMGSTDRKILYCYGIAVGNVDKENSTLEYNNRKFYDCLNNPFTDGFGIPYLYLPPITIDDTPPQYKRYI